MTKQGKFDPKSIFTEPLTFPNEKASMRLSRLVGLEEYQEILAHSLFQIFHPNVPRRWSQQHYETHLPLLDLLDDSVPLIIFEGDVGTGKTALAENIGSKIEKDYECPIQLIKMSTQVRGSGYVGEMGSLLAESFKYAINLWEKTTTPLILILDEADSLLTSREATALHHEDKSGVNTILQHLDALKNSPAQVAVIAITNRVASLDPAVKRRATDVFTFSRPSKEQRRNLLSNMFIGTGFTDNDLDELVKLSEPKKIQSKSVPYTYSDLTIRFGLQVLRDAIREDKPITLDDAALRLSKLTPTPTFTESNKER